MTLTVPQYLVLATLLPLAGFLLLIFFGRRMGWLAGALATALVVGSLGLSIAALVAWVGKETFNQPNYFESASWRWASLPAQARAPGALGEPGAARQESLTVGYYIDSLTVAMFALITFIASLVHLYSITFMAAEARAGRYFACLGLFCFAMLGVILSNSLVQLLALWAIAGAASFLLIGFWFDRRAAAAGALKAMIMNAAGDVAMVLGIGILVMHVGGAGLSFSDAQGRSMAEAVRQAQTSTSAGDMLKWGVGGNSTAPERFWESQRMAGEAGFLAPATSTGSFAGLHWLTWVGLLLFGGAAAKAAQFPLHAWLPEATEAPMPAVALVHGTAFVAAGVYLVARIYPILTVDAHVAVAILGCITLLMGAMLACVQTSIKRVLAYSTMSQAGYMMLFLGAGGYTAGIVHLFTHSLFNACLILAGASVVKALKGAGDLRQMGGLWRRLPLTALAMGVAGLALVGVPMSSGAYSRGLGLAGVYEYAREIMTVRHERAAMWLFYVPALTTFVTAFYMARAWWLTFGGRSRNEDLAEGAHESFLMVLPVGLLAAMSFNFYEVFLLPRLVEKSLLGAARGGGGGWNVIRPLEESHLVLATRSGAYATWGFLGALPALILYRGGMGMADRLRRLPAMNLLHVWLREGMFFDALYHGVALRGTLVAASLVGFVDVFVLKALARMGLLVVRGVSEMAGNIDEHFVDGAVIGVARTVRWGGWLAVMPRGRRVRVYLMAFVLGVVVLAVGLWGVLKWFM